jgi:hypothetical protein
MKQDLTHAKRTVKKGAAQNILSTCHKLKGHFAAA